MLMAHRLGRIVVSAGFVVALVVAARGDGENRAAEGVLREGFETSQPTWQRETTDTTVRLIDHERSQRAAHDGRQSERFHFEAGPGSQFFVSYALPQIPVTDDLRVSLYVRANRAGVRI